MKSENYRTCSLQELIDDGFIIGHLDGNHGNNYPRAEEFLDEGVPYISANCLVGGVVDFKKAKYLSHERASVFRKGVARNGDILFAHNATVGPVAKLITTLDKVILSTTLTYYRTDVTKIDPDYLKTFLESDYFVRQYTRVMSQSTRNQVPITTQREFEFIVPPIEKQKDIGKIISTWDRSIEATERLLENSKKRKKALMQQLLTGKRRLPGCDEEWTSVKLASIAKVEMGSSPSSEGYNENGIGLPLIQGNADIKGRRTKPRVFTSDVTKEAYPGDILMSVRAPVGEVSISDHHCCIGRGVCSIRANEDSITQDFLFQILLNLESAWASISQGSTFESVNSKDVKNLTFPIPSIKSQLKIAEVLSTADLETEAIKKTLNILVTEKSALMQQLLTGKKRVKVEEVA